ncbi:MAG: hypothetical protein QUS33_12515, partial [Dehalococcoidia bacterium]|nr:hypothetical protein [Dehalococcoidia bacterium]
MEFADGVVKAAWDRQGGRCAKCGRWLIWGQRGRESMTGAWQPHHKDPAAGSNRDAVANCVIFCSGMADCHYKIGHGGIGWSHYASLDDSSLLFLHAGEVRAEKPVAAAPEGRGSLIEAFLGISQGRITKGRKGASSKRRAEKSHKQSAGRAATGKR